MHSTTEMPYPQLELIDTPKFKKNIKFECATIPEEEIKTFSKKSIKYPSSKESGKSLASSKFETFGQSEGSEQSSVAFT